MTRHVCLLAFACLTAAASPASAQDYGKEVAGTWRKILNIRTEDGEYRWSGYPVDNFGLATFYDPPAKKKWTDSDRICATWTCLGVPKDRIPTDSKARLELNGLGDVGEGGPVTLDAKQQRKVGLSLLLPGLAQVLKLSGQLNWEKGVTTQLKLGSVVRRSVDRNALTKFIDSPENKNGLLAAGFKAGRLSYIAADIVASNIELAIVVDGKQNAGVDSALTSASGALPKDSALKFELAKTGSGTYRLVVNHPVVLAVQTRSQPSGGVLTAGGGSAKPGDAPPRVEFEAGWPVETRP